MLRENKPGFTEELKRKAQDLTKNIKGGWKTNLRSTEQKRSGRESTISRGEREHGHQ